MEVMLIESSGEVEGDDEGDEVLLVALDEEQDEVLLNRFSLKFAADRGRRPRSNAVAFCWSRSSIFMVGFGDTDSNKWRRGGGG